MIFFVSDGTSKAKQGLPKHCLDACSYAISQLELVSQQLSSGDITVLDLEKIETHSEIMKCLCDAVKREEKSGHDLHQTLKLRFDELSEYHDQRSHLECVCRTIHPTIKGM